VKKCSFLGLCGKLSPFLHQQRNLFVGLSIAGPETDPDQDQHNNLLEYFVGWDPFTIQSIQPTGFLWIDGDFLFTHRKTLETITDVQATVEVSTDLMIWKTGPTFTQAISTDISEDASLVTHKLLPDAVDPSGTYLRLRLELVVP
jgi:hypothetical protein